MTLGTGQFRDGKKMRDKRDMEKRQTRDKTNLMRNLFRCIQVLLFNALHNTFRYCSFLTLLSFLQSFVLSSSLHIVLRDVHRRLKFLLGGILGGLLVLILTFIVQLGQQVCGVGFEPEYNRFNYNKNIQSFSLL